MPTWLSASGIGSIGIVYGYILLFALKRYLPPVSQQSPSLRELGLLLTSLGVGGVIWTSVISLDGVNYIGPYGMGLLLGASLNTTITLLAERNLRRTWRENPKLFAADQKQPGAEGIK